MSRAYVGDLRLDGATGTIDLPLEKGRKSRFRVAAPRERIVAPRLPLAPDGAAQPGHESISRLRENR